MKITFRIWLLIIFIVLSAISIFGIPPIAFEKGLLVDTVEQNSDIFDQGLRSGMKIISINDVPVNTLADYATALGPVSNLEENQTIKVTIVTETLEIINLFDKSLIDDISVKELARSRIKTGLDLQGGSRALIKADVPLTI